MSKVNVRAVRTTDDSRHANNNTRTACTECVPIITAFTKTYSEIVVNYWCIVRKVFRLHKSFPTRKSSRPTDHPPDRPASNTSLTKQQTRTRTSQEVWANSLLLSQVAVVVSICELWIFRCVVVLCCCCSSLTGSSCNDKQPIPMLLNL